MITKSDGFGSLYHSLTNGGTAEIKSKSRWFLRGVVIAAPIAATVKGTTIPIIHVRIIPRAVPVSRTSLVIISVTSWRVISMPVIVRVVPVTCG